MSCEREATLYLRSNINDSFHRHLIEIHIHNWTSYSHHLLLVATQKEKRWTVCSKHSTMCCSWWFQSMWINATPLISTINIFKYGNVERMQCNWSRDTDWLIFQVELCSDSALQSQWFVGCSSSRWQWYERQQIRNDQNVRVAGMKINKRPFQSVSDGTWKRKAFGDSKSVGGVPNHRGWPTI